MRALVIGIAAAGLFAGGGVSPAAESGLVPIGGGLKGPAGLHATL